jgi:alcohol dehydrogenase (cytochrome c)
LCGSCHGADGGGISGPSLKSIHLTRSIAELAFAIENPKDPMPKFYPGTLKQQDVDDLVEFIRTLN